MPDPRKAKIDYQLMTVSPRADALALIHGPIVDFNLDRKSSGPTFGAKSGVQKSATFEDLKFSVGIHHNFQPVQKTSYDPLLHDEYKQSFKEANEALAYLRGVGENMFAELPQEETTHAPAVVDKIKEVLEEYNKRYYQRTGRAISTIVRHSRKVTREANARVELSETELSNMRAQDASAGMNPHSQYAPRNRSRLSEVPTLPEYSVFPDGDDQHLGGGFVPFGVSYSPGAANAGASSSTSPESPPQPSRERSRGHQSVGSIDAVAFATVMPPSFDDDSLHPGIAPTGTSTYSSSRPQASPATIPPSSQGDLSADYSYYPSNVSDANSGLRAQDVSAANLNNHEVSPESTYDPTRPLTSSGVSRDSRDLE